MIPPCTFVFSCLKPTQKALHLSPALPYSFWNIPVKHPLLSEASWQEEPSPQVSHQPSSHQAPTSASHTPLPTGIYTRSDTMLLNGLEPSGVNQSFFPYPPLPAWFIRHTIILRSLGTGNIIFFLFHNINPVLFKTSERLFLFLISDKPRESLWETSSLLTTFSASKLVHIFTTRYPLTIL